MPARQAGNIAEAVVWEAGASERHLIAEHALAYALARHLGQATTVTGCAGLLDPAMSRRRAAPDDLAAARRCSILHSDAARRPPSPHFRIRQHVELTSADMVSCYGCIRCFSFLLTANHCPLIGVAPGVREWPVLVAGTWRRRLPN